MSMHAAYMMSCIMSIRKKKKLHMDFEGILFSGGCAIKLYAKFYF